LASPAINVGPVIDREDLDQALIIEEPVDNSVWTPPRSPEAFQFPAQWLADSQRIIGDVGDCLKHR
jgi:hypothetical protein